LSNKDFYGDSSFFLLELVHVHFASRQKAAQTAPQFFFPPNFFPAKFFSRQFFIIFCDCRVIGEIMQLNLEPILRSFLQYKGVNTKQKFCYET
jgi:hypothetical protein